jgi:hypothetical protein
LCVLQASVEAAVAANPGRFVVANVKWTGGTEQMLDAVQQYMTNGDNQGSYDGEEQREPVLV